MTNQSPRLTPAFYRCAALCSALSALTTLLLMFLPFFYAPLEGFEGRMARVHDPVYTLRSWVYFIHPFLVLMAALAIAARIREVAPAAALIGLIGFALWGFTEAAQQSLTLFAFDDWRRAYAAADEALRAQIRGNTLVYDGLWDALYFLLLVGFAIGNACLGIALLRRRELLTRVVGAFLLGALVLTFTNIAGELGLPTLPDALAIWLYAAVQPVGRMLVGVWLWRHAAEGEPL